MQTLTVTGKRKDLRRFLHLAMNPKKDEEGKQDMLDANQFIPMPESLNIECGSRDIVYEVWYGNIDKVKGYKWVPEEIKGDREKLKEFFRKEYKEADVLADQYKFNMDNYGCKSWWDWCCRHWGSKWNFCDIYINAKGKPLEEPYKDFEDELVYWFNSAWSPMCPVIYKMGEMFPDLKFELEYEEPGFDFAGTFVMENGENTVDDCHPYISDDEEEEIVTTEEDLAPRYERLGKEKRSISNSSYGTKEGIVNIP